MLVFRKVIGIAGIVCLFCFVGVINSARALEITSLYQTSSSNEYDWGSGGWHSAYVEVDEGDCWVVWYVKRSDQPIEYHSADWISEPNRSATFSAYLSGGIKGEKYTIGAYLAKYREDVELWQFTPFTVYDTRIYKPKFVSGVKQPTPDKPAVTGVDGRVELTRHYHDGQDIVVEGYAYALNWTNKVCKVTSWFRHTEYDADGFPTGWEKQDPPINVRNPSTEVAHGKHYYKSSPSFISYPVGGPIEPEQKITLNAHIHLEVSGNGTTDVWHDNSWTHTFDHSDNQ